MRRVWKPLDVADGLRLYEVEQTFCGYPHHNKKYVVAASSPSDAARLIEEIYKDTEWVLPGAPPVYKGYALNIYQPEQWWEDGIHHSCLERENK